MSTHTTLTQVRFIMRLHSEGLNAEDIKRKTGVDVTEINRIIEVKTPKKKTKKKTAPVPEVTEES